MENAKSINRSQSNDILSIKAKNLTDTDEADFFNITTTAQAPMFTSPGNLFLEGYSMDESGQITQPIIGTFTVKGLSIDETQNLIQQNEKKFLKNATVNIKVISFKGTLLGEVNSCGYRYVYNNQITVLEDLGRAGDLNAVGSRRSVKSIRQAPKGSEEVLFGLTDPRLLQSKYFYLMPNDAIYVEPLKARSSRINLEHPTLLYAAATTANLILNYLDNN